MAKIENTYLFLSYNPMKPFYNSLLFMSLLMLSPTADAPGIDFTEVIYHREITQFKHVVKKQTELHGVWTLSPDIVICDNAVTTARMNQAVRFWKKTGYKFGTVTKNTDPLKCRKEEIGKIKIMLPSSGMAMGNNLAITNTFRIVETNENIRANITIHSFAVSRPLVLEHEIGHALGWQHTSRYGHVMNPIYEKLGHDMSGVRYSDYMRLGREIFADP